MLHGIKPEPRGWLAWLTTTDHKKIGILYLFATFLFFILGGVEALIMRLQLAQPDNTLVQPETYNGLVTVHGTTMIFLFIVPVLAGFGNYLVPLMIGARDMAFPQAERALVLAAAVRRGRLLLQHLLRAAAGRLDDVPAAVRRHVLRRRRRGRLDLHDPPDRHLVAGRARSTSSPRSTTCARRG